MHQHWFQKNFPDTFLLIGPENTIYFQVKVKKSYEGKALNSFLEETEPHRSLEALSKIVLEGG